MTMEVAAHSLFSGPDRGLLENVVLRHDNGIITDISAGAPSATSPRSLVLPAFVNAHDHARRTRTRSACPWKAGSSAPRSARRSILI